LSDLGKDLRSLGIRTVEDVARLFQAYDRVCMDLKNLFGQDKPPIKRMTLVRVGDTFRRPGDKVLHTAEQELICVEWGDGATKSIAYYPANLLFVSAGEAEYMLAMFNYGENDFERGEQVRDMYRKLSEYKIDRT